MGKVKSLRHPFSLSYKKNNGKSRYKKNGNGNGNSKTPMSHKVLFEPIEPRVLLAADLTVSNLFAHEYGVQPGETLTIDFSILNNGDAAADATRYGIVGNFRDVVTEMDQKGIER